MTDHLPPPEEPLGGQARARLRAEILAATRTSSGNRHGWVVPAAAAASVALVLGLTLWATGFPGGDPGGVPGPATGTSASPTAEGQPTTQPTTQPTPEPTEPGPDTPTSNDPVPSDLPTEVDSGACPAELEHVLKGATQAVAFPADGGTTSFWVKGDRFSLCDQRAGTVTVHQPLPLVPDLDDAATFRVSSLYPPTRDGYRTVRVAGGLVPDGALAFDVAYTFPDGHTENATTITDEQGRTWWRMVYEYDDGGGNETRKPPIEVSVTLSGSGFGFTLEWGVDTCAQANHGC